ncbi:MAG: hypothetical protein H6662_13070 [Ardenticatenaceae bacterium]|nr:hypothetical protein [Anaerolineales bacterium]MCB8922510.1 hypothetical protein [Ardenticatenaceae bacterium]MCB8989979.1 hypothetical protein [Ardenticatenaceae bacterium]
MERPRRFFKIAGGGVLLLVIAFVISYFWIKNGEYWFIVNRDDPADVATVFTLSFMRNRERSARRLVAHEEWGQLDNLIATHQAINCAIPIDGDTYLLGALKRSYEEESNTYNYDSLVSLPCSNAFYSLSIKDITLQQSNDNWQIIGWGEVCEAWGRRNDCLP